jgi:hypothetical protein
MPSLLIDSKNVKRYISLRYQKTVEKTNELYLTETGKMLQKLAKQQNF